MIGISKGVLLFVMDILIPACFSLDFQLTDFNKLSFVRYSSSRLFVVSSPYKRFHNNILLVICN